MQATSQIPIKAGDFMNVLIVVAHPEPHSLNGALARFSVSHLEQLGHQVRVSDLYAMNWEARVSPADTQHRQNAERFDPSFESTQAFEGGFQSEDIVQEQEKLLWADAVILQFPLWWFSMPAIMKGWIDRVYACGFAYGVGEHSDTHWGDRYGEGTLAGKRAMLIVTMGGWESHYSPRGINGHIDDILFPIQHGILFYPGFDVLPPFTFYRTGRTDSARFAVLRAELGDRLDNLFVTEPVAYYRQNDGNYTIPALTLRDDLAAGEQGHHVHIRKP
jgi:NAD(P)H dehydrogenase (quinone)